MKFGFIAKHRGIWPVDAQCEALGVSRSGFYAWSTRPESERSRTDRAILQTIRSCFIASDSTYGARRMLTDVRAAGHICGRERVTRLMRYAALRARPKRRAKPVDSVERQEHMISPNVLDREFTAQGPNQKWVADFTYIWTHEGWLFVAVVLDLFFASCGRLGDAEFDDCKAGDRCPADGCVEEGARSLADASFGSGKPVHE